MGFVKRGLFGAAAAVAILLAAAPAFAFEAPAEGPPLLEVANLSRQGRFQDISFSLRAGEILGWRPAHRDIVEIVGSAWAWRQAHPSGYRA